MNTRALVPLVLLTLLACGVFGAAIHIVFAYAPPLVAAQDYTVGEMLLDEGLRLEANGDVEAAAERYRRAEQARFQGTKNLRHLQFKLGKLREAVSDNALTEKEPRLWLDAWDQICTGLIEPSRSEELASTLKEWDERVAAAGLATLYPSSHDAIRDAALRDYYRGLLAKNSGDTAAAVEHYRRACIDGLARPRRELADLLEAQSGPNEVVNALRAEAAAFGE